MLVKDADLGSGFLAAGIQEHFKGDGHPCGWIQQKQGTIGNGQCAVSGGSGKKMGSAPKGLSVLILKRFFEEGTSSTERMFTSGQTASNLPPLSSKYANFLLVRTNQRFFTLMPRTLLR